ncbi:MAG: methyltransferase [Calditrichaeota bacterium]|nr:methyltransferase [Calditrichota bacterium]MBT7787441.1 methyltransferase [Calditrichota bacterium]
MPQTPREIVTRCLSFKKPERVPRDLWVLPYAQTHFPEDVGNIERDFPNDIIKPDYEYPASPIVRGERYAVGYCTDAWGCEFKNIQAGIIGEVETPIIRDISDWKSVRPPYEQIPDNTAGPYENINRFCANTDKFVIANCCPRPWERYQFLRGSENALIDMMMPDYGARDLIKAIHDFYLKEFEFWVKTDVDAIWFMDDWGAQNQLLINPEIWRELFKPLYKDYCDLAAANDKFIMMHTDGHVTEIFADLIEVGLDAINSQLFCMDISELAKIGKGKITFWGEIDRQHILPSADVQKGRDAVQKVASHLYDPSGGVIAQFEFGLGMKPEMAVAVLEEWGRIK